MIGQIKEEKSKLESYILQGQLPDYAAYKFYTGQLIGLQAAIDILQETLNRVEND
jgi:hypothetical protein